MKTRLKITALVFLAALPVSSWAEAGRAIEYQVNGEANEGYFVSAGDDAPLIW